MQEGKTIESVATLAEQIASLDPGGCIGIRGEFHQTDRAAGAGLDAEIHHPRAVVMTGIKPRVGTEGLTLVQDTAQEADATGLQRMGVEGMRFRRFPERQEVLAKPDHTGVGNVLETKVKGIGTHPTRLLTAEHAAVQHLTGGLLLHPAFGAHKTVGERNTPLAELQGGDHPIAIKGVMHTLPPTLQSPGTIAVQRSSEL